MLVPQVGLEPTRLSALVPKTSVAAITPPGQNKYSMINERTAMESLYQVANTQPYMPSAYATTSRQFKPDPIMTSPRRVFKPDPILVPPPGSDPGSPDFQSGAMTTSAKEAI